MTTDRFAGRAPLLVAVLALSLPGCALLPLTPPGPEPVVEPQLPPKLEPLPAPQSEVPTAKPAPAPRPSPPVSPPPVLETPLRVAVLLSDRGPAFAAVADALADEVETLDVYDLSDKSITPREMFLAMQAVETNVVVAVGLRATALASRFEDMPVVFSQVFNVSQIDLAEDNLKGVSVLPPLALQLEAWLALNPNLSSVGAIVGDGHERLLQEATAAANDRGIRFQHRLAQSDRETLYQFTRLVPEIDGFWLFPDNRILSGSTLRQMLDYAARHRVQVAVFNDALLPLGATISATAVDQDIAATVIDVAKKVVHGAADDVPAVTPLNDIRVRIPERQMELARGPNAVESFR